jgi:hypothetical protein
VTGVKHKTSRNGSPARDNNKKQTLICPVLMAFWFYVGAVPCATKETILKRDAKMQKLIPVKKKMNFDPYF